MNGQERKGDVGRAEEGTERMRIYMGSGWDTKGEDGRSFPFCHPLPPPFPSHPIMPSHSSFRFLKPDNNDYLSTNYMLSKTVK